MLTFNNNNIFTGYIKQLLASYNLPNYRVYTAENAAYHEWAVNKCKELEEAGVDKTLWPPLEKDILETIENEDSLKYPNNLRYALYIKDGELQKYVNKKWETLPISYHENKKELNNTRTLSIANNIYDTNTHEYLGEFLRFIRDYYDINLMPLYNCFSNNLCPKLYLHLQDGITVDSVFDTDDTFYKIYMIPVKLFKKYTIAIDCATPIEVCCGFYGAYQDNRDKLKYISDFTYQKFNSCRFNKPVVFNKLTSEYLDPYLVGAMELAQNENDLKLFIKLPASNNSSITILEGDYTGYNDTAFIKDENNKLKYLTNHTIINFEKRSDIPDIEVRQLNLITNLQLLTLNTGESYPFADRLIEYLTGNAITPNDMIADNVKRVQTILVSWGILPLVYGAWDNKMRAAIYEYMTKKAPSIKGINHDILGFVDKDVEKYLVGNPAVLDKNSSISNIDIYPQLYKSLKNK